MSLEVLSTEFNAYKQECAKDRNALAAALDKNLAAIDAKIAVLSTSIENRVTYEYFHWVVGGLMLILMGINGYIVVEIKEMSAQVTSVDRTSAVTQNDVVTIKGIIDKWEIQTSK